MTVETTEAAETTAAPETTAAEAAAETTAAPETTEAAPVDTEAPATLPENVSQLDSSVTLNINEQPRESIQEGGAIRLAVTSLAENWNPFTPEGNERDFADLTEPMTYFPYLVDGDGVPTPNPDYVLEVTESQDPFTVTYTLNPEAVWHSGDPITVADWQQNWVMLNGVDPSVNTVTTEGYELISSVEAGVDEFQVVVTFCETYPDYEALFNPLLPASAIGDVAAFNEGWVGDLPNDWFTGPFEVSSYDSALGIVDQVPSDTWWGEAPLLETITWQVISSDVTPQSFANNEIDAFDIGPDPNGYALAYNTPGGEIRAAAGPNWRQITMNSGPNGGLIQDQVVRQAIQMSLDRAAIGVSDLAGIPWDAKPLGNHIFVENNAAYVDNSGEFGTYNPEGARALLEENGWVLGDDGVFEKDGTRLTVRFFQITGVPVSENEARLTQSQLAEVGIEVEIVDMSQQDWSNILTAGEFEMMAFTWVGTPFPYTGVRQLWGTGSDSNFGFSNIPEIDPLIDQLQSETDEVERARIGNEIDVILWEAGHTVPLYQRPELWAVNANIANYGAIGLMKPRIWTNVGWTG